MKTKLSIFMSLIFFSFWQILAQDIRIFTDVKTNLETQSIYITEAYTRNGMTNLVCKEKIKNGFMQIRLQNIYHDGKLIGLIDDDKVNKLFGISTEANAAYDLGFQFYPDKTLQSVSLGTNGVIIDSFSCTNGILYPVDESVILKANDFGAGGKRIT